MRPLRLLLSVCFFILVVLLTFYSLIYSHPRHELSSSSPQVQKTGLRSFFSFHAPATLFPPSAIISLTDDNSTFFLSRPSDYGPSLASEGQSGQLWIGSGFGEDLLSKGGLGAQAEGEQGCSDIPGWSEGQYGLNNVAEGRTTPKDDGGNNQANKADQKRSDSKSKAKVVADKNRRLPKEDDGTDDHLHFPLTGVPLARGRSINGKAAGNKEGERVGHGDIQSIQEGAEIAGKVVLLSRGGCGFLEKTKWVQRRGGIALIVGDNTRGGPLITMYAHGDTSNITIPSLFTSRTTAHLLSSLIPGAGKTAQIGKGDSIPTKSVPGNRKGGTPIKDDQNGPIFTPVGSSQKTNAATDKQNGQYPKAESGWLGSFASKVGLRRENVDGSSSRPPSSGHNDWIVSEDWDDDTIAAKKSSENVKKQSKNAKGKGKNDSKNKDNSKEDFHIGVQDWRDPDMMRPAPTTGTQAKGQAATAPHHEDAQKDSSDKAKSNDKDKVFAGGSYTPGSGVYHLDSSVREETRKPSSVETDSESSGWLSRIFHDSEDTGSTPKSGNKVPSTNLDKTKQTLFKAKDFDGLVDVPANHEGLWVTMTPASMSTTPFFDTLLVLVVSPLVTLTVVYALLLLRSRIRRRRWRAPKSVVEQLPVHTYHTMSCSSSSTSSQTPSPQRSSPASPLLNSNSRSGLTRTRPRSRTTSTISDQASSTLEDATSGLPGMPPAKEKLRVPRRYNGRQIECVVCLEEYVDGQSQVMSLPCGHEFHAECITPWLTTRRRTCPICKGDVVRSLNDASSAESSSPRRYRDDPEAPDAQNEIAQTRNDSPSSAIPIPRNSDEDVERDGDLAETLVNDRPVAYTPRRGWRELAARSLSALSGSGDRSWRQTREDRSR